MCSQDTKLTLINNSQMKNPTTDSIDLDEYKRKLQKALQDVIDNPLPKRTFKRIVKAQKRFKEFHSLRPQNPSC